MGTWRHLAVAIDEQLMSEYCLGGQYGATRLDGSLQRSNAHWPWHRRHFAVGWTWRSQVPVYQGGNQRVHVNHMMLPSDVPRSDHGCTPHRQIKRRREQGTMGSLNSPVKDLVDS